MEALHKRKSDENKLIIMNLESKKVETIRHTVRIDNDEIMSIHISGITRDSDVNELLHLLKSKYALCFQEK